MQINAMGTGQMSQRHAAGLLHGLYDGFVVFSDDQTSLLLWTPRVGKVLRGIKELTVWIELTGIGDDRARFRFLGRGC